MSLSTPMPKSKSMFKRARINEQAHKLQKIASNIYAQKETLTSEELMVLLKSFPLKDAPGKVREVYEKIMEIVNNALIAEQEVPSIERKLRTTG